MLAIANGLGAAAHAFVHQALVHQALVAADTSQQAPNPIAPSVTEIAWGSISFLILVVAMYFFAFPSVKKMMQARTDKIRGDLSEAEKVRTDAQMILEEYQKQLADARSEANRIIEEARQAADQLRQDMVRRADEEVAEMRRRNVEDLKAAQDRVLSQLQLQVRDLAIELAEKVVGANLDRTRNLALVDQLIAELQARPAGG